MALQFLLVFIFQLPLTTTVHVTLIVVVEFLPQMAQFPYKSVDTDSPWKRKEDTESQPWLSQDTLIYKIPVLLYLA